MKSRVQDRLFSAGVVLALSLVFVPLLIGYSFATPHAQTPSTSDEKVELTFSTDPSPAREGANTVTVKLVDARGKAIPGARVTVAFFMPAMPAMNMAAMKTTITATEKASGTYEGKINLPSSGIWQVTITAKRNGRAIALKKLSVKANRGA